MILTERADDVVLFAQFGASDAAVDVQAALASIMALCTPNRYLFVKAFVAQDLVGPQTNRPNQFLATA